MTPEADDKLDWMNNATNRGYDGNDRSTDGRVQSVNSNRGRMRRSLLQGVGIPGSYDDEQRLKALLAATGAHEKIIQEKGQ
eukprot:COSAG05_NODE_42_length_26187_cov_393.972286_25_plen_81_part_00